MPRPWTCAAAFYRLCFFRADLRVKNALETKLTEMRRKDGYTPVISWLTLLKFQIEDAPSDYPFSLNEREFAYYAEQNFGGEMKDISDIYKPANFYKALAEDVAVLGLGAALGATLPVLVPAWAAAEGAGAVLAEYGPAAARGVVGTLGGAGLKTVFPGGSWDAAKKDRLWRRYKLEYERRSQA